ncbi:cell wall assembly regulator SMI1 [Chitinophaga dinghuensis]|uniref:Cell wall assembly regulator SMI1 n=1 Tax=Chitinophaga dinghuensis TaxID=1539050 RepID=A0A327W755_9BACT|nr:SMI1/KNR4 family protein [Chitinophaga dinghuensis]RAJ85850.1 cell wall assembly regulator SMI1 [Chitinophaga dinghuensis]
MQEYWTRWELWMRNHAPKMVSILNPGTSYNDMKDLETLTGLPIPDSFRIFYAIHNGQKSSRAGLVNGDKLLSIKEIAEEWTSWKNLLENGAFTHNGEVLRSEPDTGIRPEWWNTNWLPFTSDGLGNHLCLDFDPASGGNIGQIITMWHDDTHREVIASSFEDWVKNYITSLENGEYVYQKKWGIVRKDSRYNFKD